MNNSQETTNKLINICLWGIMVLNTLFAVIFLKNNVKMNIIIDNQKKICDKLEMKYDYKEETRFFFITKKSLEVK